MSARGERTLWIALGALVVAAAAFAWLRVERREREIEVGFQGEAREDPYLAAERFLGRMGIPARKATGLALLPPADHLLVLSLPGHALDATRAERLLGWVRSGGHVLAAATASGTTWSDLDRDPLLQACGVGGRPVGEPSAEAALPSILARRRERKLTVAGERRPLALLVRSDVALVPRGDAPAEEGPVADPSPDPVAVTCRAGSGRITVLADLLFATNAEIGERDHARLLWRLAGLDGARAGASFVAADAGDPSLMDLALSRGLPLVLAIALLGAAAAVRGAVRFGPPLPLPARGRRSLLEHVEAVGALLWRRKRQDVLLSATRAALQARAAARRPGLGRLSASARLQALAAASGVSAEELRFALQEPGPSDPEGYVRAVRTLQTVRRSL